jgi:hypothetical protein
LPPESSTLTTGWVARAAPLASVAEGSVVMASWVAAPKVLGEKFAELPETVGALVVCATSV